MESLQWLVFLSRSEAVGEKNTHKLGVQSPQCLVNTSPQNGKKDSALSLNLEGKKKNVIGSEVSIKLLSEAV